MSFCESKASQDFINGFEIHKLSSGVMKEM